MARTPSWHHSGNILQGMMLGKRPKGHHYYNFQETSFRASSWGRDLKSIMKSSGNFLHGKLLGKRRGLVCPTWGEWWDVGSYLLICVGLLGTGAWAFSEKTLPLQKLNELIIFLNPKYVLGKYLKNWFRSSQCFPWNRTKRERNYYDSNFSSKSNLIASCVQRNNTMHLRKRVCVCAYVLCACLLYTSRCV